MGERVMKLILSIVQTSLPYVRKALKELFPLQTPLVETRDLGSQMLEISIVLEAPGYSPEQIGWNLSQRAQEIWQRGMNERLKELKP
jgi:hypothetical protein